MKFLFLFIVTIFFQFAKADRGETEAHFGAGAESLDFCCDREYKKESAHSLSERESHKIVTRLLGKNIDFSIQRRPKPTRGQRGQR